MIWPWLYATRIEISVRGRSRSLAFLLTVGCASLFLAAETSLVGGTLLFEAPSAGRWLLAVDSDDPWLQNRLAQAYKDTNPPESVRRLRRATELSPYSRFYWDDLASTCQSQGDLQCADRAAERLVSLCPMVPFYRELAARSCVRAKRLDESVAQFRRLLELDPSYASDTWDSLRTVMGPELIFQKVLADSADSNLKVGYVDYLSAQGDNDPAYRIWRLIAASPGRFTFSSARPYLDRLIELGRIEEAGRVWQDLERLGIVKRSGADEKGNLIFNGDFEQLPLNAGLDWRWSDQMADLAVDFAAYGAYHGAHCLRVDFTVPRNQDYEPVYQFVPVLPNRTYELQAYVRSKDIVSSTGPALRAADTRQPGFEDAVTEPTLGTTDWRPVRLIFTTGPETRAVRLSVWRPRGRVFPMEITGSFWVDAVSLKSLGESGHRVMGSLRQ
jgi:hypothetical protein